MGSDTITDNRMNDAAEGYSAGRRFPETERIYRLELELAFLAGVEWHSQQKIERLERLLSKESE